MLDLHEAQNATVYKPQGSGVDIFNKFTTQGGDRANIDSFALQGLAAPTVWQPTEVTGGFGATYLPNPPIAETGRVDDFLRANGVDPFQVDSSINDAGLGRYGSAKGFQSPEVTGGFGSLNLPQGINLSNPSNIDTYRPVGMTGSSTFQDFTAQGGDRSNIAGYIPQGQEGYNPDAVGNVADTNTLGAKGFDYKGALDIGGSVVNLGKDLYGIYQGQKQMKLAEEQLDYNRMTGERDYDNKRSDYNRRLYDQQQMRHASNPTTYQSPEAHLARYGIK